MIPLDKALKWIDTLGKRIPGEKIFLLYLINIMQDEPERGVQVSAEKVGDALEMSKRGLQRHVSRLQIRGILEIKNTKDNGRIGANIYYLPGWSKS